MRCAVNAAGNVEKIDDPGAEMSFKIGSRFEKSGTLPLRVSALTPMT